MGEIVSVSTLQETAEAVPPPCFDKVDSFKLKIQGGLLNNLGIQMYTKLGKVLVEFAANAFDSDSVAVDIGFDVAQIAAARQIVRAAAKARLIEKIGEVTKGGKKFKVGKARIVVDPLPSDITVTISDTGHGMTPTEIADRFLPINRNRRRDEVTGTEKKLLSEAGRRFVMGRKGIGKLSAFGAADTVTVRSKRVDQRYWTLVTLRSSQLLKSNDLGEVELDHAYEDAAPGEFASSGTSIILSDLRCDAVNFTEDDLRAILNETFYPIKTNEFAIRLNGVVIEKIEPELEYLYPEGIAADAYSTETLRDEAWGELDFQYRVRFRKKSLPAEKRGAYIYSKDRLAADPSLLGLNTGTHNFMAHQYMECFVLSDDLDNLEVDVIGTNRAGIIRNSDLVRAFLDRITAIMTEAIKQHAAFRDRVADKVIDEAPAARQVREILDVVPTGQRKAARQLAKILVAQYGADSEEFANVAPLIMGAANAGQVLVDLIRVSNNPVSVREIANKIVQLREIERSDALKTFQGRRNGIIGLRKLIATGESNWVKGPQTEKELHLLLRDAPWLIRPELSDFVASDVSMDEVLGRLAREFKIGVFAEAVPVMTKDEIDASTDPDDAEKKATLRPDLVSLIGDTVHPNRVLVIELKSTAIPMRMEHLNQLERYMRRVEEHFRTEYPNDRVYVEGILIGAMPAADTRSDPQLDLLRRIHNRAYNESWEVIGLNDLLRRTEAVHREMIGSLKKDESTAPDALVDVVATVPLSGEPDPAPDAERLDEACADGGGERNRHAVADLAGDR